MFEFIERSSNESSRVYKVNSYIKKNIFVLPGNKDLINNLNVFFLSSRVLFFYNKLAKSYQFNYFE